MPLQNELWTRLEAFNLDEEGSTFSYSARLARENGWTNDYARRVVLEYKKFLYLGMCAGHPISPSDSIDEVWHLHLVYTRSYWDELCPKVLGAPFHHEPSRGGGSEDRKFENWYAQTLQSYRRVFGEEPPDDIWPCVQEYAAPLPPHPQTDVERVQQPRFDLANFPTQTLASSVFGFDSGRMQSIAWPRPLQLVRARASSVLLCFGSGRIPLFL